LETVESPQYTYLFSTEDALKLNGKFGSTFVARVAENNKKVVLKRIAETAARKPELLHQLLAEASLKIEQQVIAKSIEWFKYAGQYYLVREYAEGCNWRTFSQKQPALQTQLGIALKCLQCIAALHNAGLLHNDIRPDNFIINENNLSVTLIDLGLAQQLSKQKKPMPFSLVYSPPEQVLRCYNLLNASSDLYAFGVSLFEMLSGSSPFYNANPEIVMHLQLTQPLPQHHKLKPELYSILKKATQKPFLKLPPNRYNTTELLNLLQAANELRYQQATDFATDIKNLNQQ
jgi:serine/threonine protein kinase